MLPSLRKFNQSEVVKERQKIINYYDHYGGLATLDAFGVDRKLIYVWRQRLRLNQKKPSALATDFPATYTEDLAKTATYDAVFTIGTDLSTGASATTKVTPTIIKDVTPTATPAE